MKKIILIAALAFGVAFAASAQPRAVGGRFGYSGLEASYQHYLGGENFIEAELGLDYIGLIGVKGTALYNFMIAQPAWTARGEWGLYAGPGLSLGYVGDRVSWNTRNHVSYWGYDNGFMMAVTGQIGLEYTFWFPLQLSVDIRPYIGVHIHGHGGEAFYNNGLYGFAPCLSVRYRF